MMKVLVTGVKGQLGFDIVKACQEANIEAIGVDIEQMDITDYEAVCKVIKKSEVDAVIHCSAYTAVDKAEEDVDTCNRVNIEGTRNIALVCQELNLKMMYFSTDYVFDGQGQRPWQVDDAASPINVYGQSKYLGEQEVRNLIEKHFIIRISWVFGINGNNFVKTMLRLGDDRDEINVVDDQFGAPTYTYDLARLAVDMIQSDKYGTYHATNEGDISWYEFAKEIFAQAGVEVKVNPVSSTQFKSAAKRPSNSRMDKSRLDQAGFKRLPSWQDALKRYLIELQK